MLKNLILAAALGAAAAPSVAQVYKCPGPGGVTYQAQPCEGGGGKVDLKVHQPTEAERRRAEAQKRKNQAFNAEVEGEQAAARRRAQSYTQDVQDRKDAKAAACKGYDEEIARLEGTKDKWVSPALREQDYRRIEELKRTRFSECR